MDFSNRTEILALSVPERILLVEDIWDSIVEIPQEITLTEAQKLELESRLAAYHENPAAGSAWATVRDRIRNLSEV
ncbi:MAG: addiction module protein [Spirochaetota bacterium]